MNDDVREVIITAAVDEMMFGTFDDLALEHQATIVSLADAILSALADKGYVVVEKADCEALPRWSDRQTINQQQATIAAQAATIEQYRLFIREMDEVLRYSCWSERVQRLRAAITDVPYPLERLPFAAITTDMGEEE